MGQIVVCPFCLSIFMSEVDPGDQCPDCEVGELLEYDEYKLRLNSSFMEFISEERGNNDI